MISKQLWTNRVNECQESLGDLLGPEGEFKDIKDSVYLQIRHSKEPDIAGRLIRNFVYKGHALVIIYSAIWQKWPDLNHLYDIEPIIRHELLHLETDRNDGDPAFEEECKKRSIPLLFKKAKMDLTKEITSEITERLLKKIRSGELVIVDNSKQSELVEIIDSSKPEGLFELLEYIENEVEKQTNKAYKQAITEAIGEAVRECQEYEINKILEET